MELVFILPYMPLTLQETLTAPEIITNAREYTGVAFWQESTVKGHKEWKFPQLNL